MVRPYHHIVEFDEPSRWLDTLLQRRPNGLVLSASRTSTGARGEIRGKDDGGITHVIESYTVLSVESWWKYEYRRRHYVVNVMVQNGMIPYDYARMREEGAVLAAELLRYVMSPKRMTSVAKLEALSN
jgi:hypothetical protein